MIELGIERELEARFEEFVAYMTKRLYNTLTGYLEGAVNDFRKKQGVRAVLSYQSDIDVPTVSLRIEVTIPPEEIERLRRVFYKMIKENTSLARLRIRALYRLITDEVLTTSGGAGAVLPDMRPGPAEGAPEAGGAGAEVRDQEGGSAAEGASQNDLRGV